MSTDFEKFAYEVFGDHADLVARIRLSDNGIEPLSEEHVSTVNEVIDSLSTEDRTAMAERMEFINKGLFTPEMKKDLTAAAFASVASPFAELFNVSSDVFKSKYTVDETAGLVALPMVLALPKDVAPVEVIQELNLRY